MGSDLRIKVNEAIGRIQKKVKLDPVAQAMLSAVVPWLIARIEENPFEARRTAMEICQAIAGVFDLNVTFHPAADNQHKLGVVE